MVMRWKSVCFMVSVKGSNPGWDQHCLRCCFAAITHYNHFLSVYRKWLIQLVLKQAYILISRVIRPRQNQGKMSSGQRHAGSMPVRSALRLW